MPTPTYTPLANVTLASATATVTFSNIPATYRDLILITDHTGAASGVDVFLSLNSDIGTNYTRVLMYGNSTTTGALSGTSDAVSALYGSNRHTMIMNVMDYSATDKHKTILIRNNNAQQSEVVAGATRWANTAAINSIRLGVGTSFSTGSTFSLYGVIG